MVNIAKKILWYAFTTPPTGDYNEAMIYTNHSIEIISYAVMYIKSLGVIQIYISIIPYNDNIDVYINSPKAYKMYSKRRQVAINIKLAATYSSEGDVVDEAVDNIIAAIS